MNPLQDYKLYTVRSAAILTTSYVAGDVIGADQYPTYQQNQLVIYVNLTLGSLTSAQLLVEFSHDNSNWYPETSASISGSTSTDTPIEHSFTSSSINNNRRIPIQIKDRYIRISVKGTGTVSGSSCTVYAVVGLS